MRRLSGIIWTVPVVLLVSCSVPSPRGGIGRQCELNSECAAPLICRIGYCRSECVTSVDCLAPSQCVHDDAGRGVCQTPAELSCVLQSECTDPLVCRFNRCVNDCAEDRDCPPGQSCRETACIDDVRGPCTRDRDCLGDLVCSLDGLCREECRTNRDCRDNDYCTGVADRRCSERATACVDPDEDSLRACYQRCGVDGGVVLSPCELGQTCDIEADETAGLCRPSCALDSTDPMSPPDPAACEALGPGWECGPDNLCIPDIPDPLADAGRPDGGGMDTGTGDGGTDAGDTGTTDGGDTGTRDAGDGGDAATPLGCSGSPLTGIVDFSAGGTHACAVTGAGATTELLCWGSFGDIGDPGAITSAPCPTVVPAFSGQPIADVDVGGVHTCVVLASGQVMCWGTNLKGELGRGTMVSPQPPGLVTGLTGMTNVDATWTNTCAWGASGDAYCWGWSLWGTVGTTCRRCPSPGMTSLVYTTPQVVTITPQPHGLSLGGGGHTCGLVGTRPTGRVDCWGKDEDRLGPPIPGLGLPLDGIQVAAGNGFSCAILTDSSLWCWGANHEGQLGDATTTDRAMPAVVSGLPAGGVRQVAADNHACATAADGSVWCWGMSANGRVRADLTGIQSTPVQVIASGATKVEVGAQYSCAQVGDELRCWGVGGGQLGDGLSDSAARFTTVAAP